MTKKHKFQSATLQRKTKEIIVLFCVLAMSSTSVADYFTDFEDSVVGGSDLDTKPGWSYTGATAPIIMAGRVTTTGSANRSKVMQIGHNQTPTFNPAPTNQYSQGALEFDLLMNGPAGYPNLMLYVSDDDLPLANRAQIMLRVAEENGAGGTGLDLYDYAGGKVVLTDFMSKDNWTHLKIDFDADTDTYDFYVDDSLKLDDQPARNNFTRINRITWSNPVGYHIQIDNVKLSFSAAQAEDRALVKQIERSVINPYNETMVNLGYLKDEAEGLKRSIYYIDGVTNTAFATEVVTQCDIANKGITARLANICGSFYGLFEKPSELNYPIKSLRVAIKDKDKRKILDDCARKLVDLSDKIARMREALAQQLSRLRSDQAFKKAFPKYRVTLPAQLPPVEIAADGTLKRIIFAGPYGRTETMLSLKFDTLNEGGSPVWARHETDAFEHDDAKYQSQWDRFQIPASDTCLHYAIGAGMYRPPWFADVYGEDVDYYFMPSMQGDGGFDYRHPVPRKMILEYLEGAARFHGQKPFTFVYKGPWEAHPYRGTSVSIPGKRTVAFEELGFGKYAIKAFRNYLRDKFKTIEKLNKAWRSSYKSFDNIQPPEKLVRAFTITKDARGQDVYTRFLPNKRLPGASTTPLTYEFERCRKDLYCDYLADCYQAIKRGDPKHPVASSTSGGIMDEILVNSIDDLQMAERCVDMWGKHPSGGIGWADSPYQYGLNRYFKKTLVALEFYGWAQEEIGNDFWSTATLAPGTTIESVYNNARRDTWHEYSWGRRMLLFYWVEKLVELKLPPGGRKWADGVRPDTSPLIRPWANMVPVVKRRLTNINDILINTPIIAPRIGVLHSGVSIINAYPTNSCAKITEDLFDRLISKQYHFGVISEKFILNGRDSLENYDVIILPYVQYFDDGFGKKLLAWVKNGGTLISSGPFGLYSKYGFEIEDGAAKVFDDVEFTYPTPDEYKLSWEWNAKRNGKKLLEKFLVKNYGCGKVLLTPDGRGFKRAGSTSAEAHVGIELGGKMKGESSPDEAEEENQDETIRPLKLGYDEDLSPAAQAFYKTLKEVTKRKAWVESGNIEMIIRQKEVSEPLYVSMLNWDYKNEHDTTVVVRGEFHYITDLSIEGGFPVATVVKEGMTKFNILFGPGEGVMLKLH